MNASTTTSSVNQAHLDAVASVGRPDHCPMMPTFGAPTVMFVKGKGTELWDANGKRYLDFLCGLAVTGLGHGNDEIADAISAQARTLVHVSNLFATDVGPRVAMQLDALLGGGGQVFFGNSGAEANECAIKVARKWGGHGKFQVISAFGSFHGRTLATLHMTGQPAKHEAFQPLPDGFKHAVWGDAGDVERMIDPSVVAVMVEPVQGEGGVIPAPPGYLRDLRKLCTERGLLFMIDEIQTGLGRTGKWWGFEHHLHADERPDVITVAKQLGNGMPIGACWAKKEIAGAFKPGDHGSTFSGQPLASSAALKVLEIMQRENIPQKAASAGAYLSQQLRGVPGISEVRGDGLLLAVELDAKNSKDVHAELLRLGIVTNNVTPSALRIAPPMNVSNEHIDEAVRAIGQAIANVAAVTTGSST